MTCRCITRIAVEVKTHSCTAFALRRRRIRALVTMHGANFEPLLGPDECGEHRVDESRGGQSEVEHDAPQLLPES